MRKERQISDAREFQMMHKDISPSKREGVAPTPSESAAYSDFLPKRTLGRGARVTSS